MAVAATSNSVKFRMPVFAGFAAIQTGTPVLLNDSSLNINADTLIGSTLPSGLIRSCCKRTFLY